MNIPCARVREPRVHYGNWPTANWIILNIPSLGEINRLLPICSNHKSLVRREFPLSPGCVFKSAALFAQAGQPSVISASAGRNLSLFICLISTILGLCTSNNEPIVPWADITKITPSIASKTKDWLNKPTYDLWTVWTKWKWPCVVFLKVLFTFLINNTNMWCLFNIIQISLNFSNDPVIE